MQKKYELTDDYILVESEGGECIRVYRIRALRDIPRYGVRIGDLGGFVKSEANLSHEGDSWIADNAIVSDNTTVQEDCVVLRLRLI